MVSISGDGGFMFAVQEIATAVQHGINLVSGVFNDNAYGKNDHDKPCVCWIPI
ncbi:thiamine pyrophosphate-dependent enzyme [uncultured Pseudoalteromonas sp.]|uniref:thiamine pyrophosphate-dependent enzyme n=1 Tax=uncultured Pseudoalteromonas sp. TaxID=114053 RepID=UPI00261E731F|nr:thiamine pyrophosphate-dependent enzyme [uncultured Pseudoalteromonas sp.]